MRVYWGREAGGGPVQTRRGAGASLYNSAGPDCVGYVFVYLLSIIICRWYRRSPTAVAQWLRRCTTNRKVAGSIPDVIGIFHSHNPSDRTMALGSTQPLAEMSTRSISWG